MANVVLHFYRWDSIYITRPDIREGGFLPLLDRQNVVRKLERRDIDHNVAVVILGYRYSRTEQENLIRDWQSLLRAEGFRRVVFLRADRRNQDQIDGLPILCDSAIAGGT